MASSGAVQSAGVKRADRIGAEKISKLLWEFGVPATIGILVNVLYSIVDSIFVGHTVGTLGIAATTAAFPSILIMMAFGMLIGGGGNALMSIKLGEKDSGTASKILGNSLMMMMVISVFVTAAGLIFLKPILTISGASPTVMPYAASFTSIIFCGMIAQCVGFGMNNFIRTTGSPRRAMVTMLVGAGMNIVLDYILVIRMGMGVRGAAIATVIAQSINSIIVLYYFLGKKAPIRLRLEAMIPDFGLMKTIVSLGAASFFVQIAASAVNIVINSSLMRYGVDTSIGSSGALAAMGVVIKSAEFFILPALGFVYAAQPIIGYNYGAKRFDRVAKTFKEAVKGVTVYMVIVWVIVGLFPGFITNLFGLKEAGVAGFASIALRMFMLMTPIIGFQMLGSGYFQATGQPTKSIVLSLTRQVIFLIPLLLLAPLVAKAFGFSGMALLFALLIAPPVSDLCSVILTGVFVAKEFSHLDEAHARNLAGHYRNDDGTDSPENHEDLIIVPAEI